MERWNPGLNGFLRTHPAGLDAAIASGSRLVSVFQLLSGDEFLGGTRDQRLEMRNFRKSS
jgi:hypothetical protein